MRDGGYSASRVRSHNTHPPSWERPDSIGAQERSRLERCSPSLAPATASTRSSTRHVESWARGRRRRPAARERDRERERMWGRFGGQVRIATSTQYQRGAKVLLRLCCHWTTTTSLSGKTRGRHSIVYTSHAWSSVLVAGDWRALRGEKREMRVV